MTRKTKTVLITACLLLTVTAVSVLAASGGTSDPLASLSYLTGTFTDAVDRQVEERLARLSGGAAVLRVGAATKTGAAEKELGGEGALQFLNGES